MLTTIIASVVMLIIPMPFLLMVFYYGRQVSKHDKKLKELRARKSRP